MAVEKYASANSLYLFDALNFMIREYGIPEDEARKYLSETFLQKLKLELIKKRLIKETAPKETIDDFI